MIEIRTPHSGLLLPVLSLFRCGPGRFDEALLSK